MLYEYSLDPVTDFGAFCSLGCASLTGTLSQTLQGAPPLDPAKRALAPLDSPHFAH